MLKYLLYNEYIQFSFVLFLLFLMLLFIISFCNKSLSINIKKNVFLLFQVIINGTIIFLLLTLFRFKYGFYIIGFLLVLTKVRDICNIIILLFNYKTVFNNTPIKISKDKTHNICCLIPVYTENIKSVQNNIDSLCEQDLQSNVNITLFIICDGLIIGKQNNKSLFEELSDIINFTDNTLNKYDFITWKNQKQNTLNFKFGNYKNVDIVLSYKENNTGKKDSLIIGEEMINIFDDFDYIYHTDSDTVADKNCLKNLLYTLDSDESIDGVSGLIRTIYYENEDYSFFKTIYEKTICLLQEYQYFHSIVLRRQTESLFNTTICLPGCVNLIRLNEKSKYAMEKYKQLPENNDYINIITTMQGTDRKYTSLILEKDAKLRLNINAVVYTEPPNNLTSFIKQRRRWSSNAFYNSLSILLNKNLKYYIKFSTCIEIIKLYTIFFRFFSYITFFIYLFIRPFDRNFYIFSLFIIMIPYIYTNIIGAIILPNYKKMFLSFILNITCIWMPIVYSYIIIKMFFTTTDFKWGTENTEVVVESDNINEVEEFVNNEVIIQIRD